MVLISKCAGALQGPSRLGPSQESHAEEPGQAESSAEEANLQSAAAREPALEEAAVPLVVPERPHPDQAAQEPEQALAGTESAINRQGAGSTLAGHREVAVPDAAPDEALHAPMPEPAAVNGMEEHPLPEADTAVELGGQGQSKHIGTRGHTQPQDCQTHE